MIDKTLLTFLGFCFIVGTMAIFFSGEATRKKFETECNAVNGTTIFDGRQYQCLQKEILK